MSFLLDTNVVSALGRRRGGEAQVREWARGQSFTDFYLSVVTLSELEVGVLGMERKDPAQGAVLRVWLDAYVVPRFRGRTLPIDEAIARKNASLHVPDRRPLADALIAATAIVHKLTVVTRNVADFAPMDVPLLNPWEAAR